MNRCIQVPRRRGSASSTSRRHSGIGSSTSCRPQPFACPSRCVRSSPAARRPRPNGTPPGSGSIWTSPWSTPTARQKRRLGARPRSPSHRDRLRRAEDTYGDRAGSVVVGAARAQRGWDQDGDLGSALVHRRMGSRRASTPAKSAMPVGSLPTAIGVSLTLPLLVAMVLGARGRPRRSPVRPDGPDRRASRCSPRSSRPCAAERPGPAASSPPGDRGGRECLPHESASRRSAVPRPGAGARTAEPRQELRRSRPPARGPRRAPRER